MLHPQSENSANGARDASPGFRQEAHSTEIANDPSSEGGMFIISSPKRLVISFTSSRGGVTSPQGSSLTNSLKAIMHVNVQIPAGVQPGGYVPVVLTVGSASNVAGAAWIAVAGN